jgi:hypothetical protein
MAHDTRHSHVELSDSEAWHAGIDQHVTLDSGQVVSNIAIRVRTQPL